jgi:hypothetical protein
MSELGLKEKAVVAVLGVVVLYAVAIATWFLNSEKAWKHAAKSYERASVQYEKETKLISEAGKWDELYESERAAMPMFEDGKATDTTWRSKVEELAKANLVQVHQIEHGKEIETGDVLQLPIEIKSFEASLEALVKFMHSLDSAEDGMFDVKSLSVKPSNKKGYLKGSLSLTCAYMREDGKAER